MVKKARPIAPAETAPKKKLKRKKPVTITAQPFRFIAFGDTHTNNETIDRVCRLLDIIGEKASEHDADIICMGDFWDLRGTLNVRQVDRVLDKLESIPKRKIFVPGNHDQVTLDGTIHGMNIFRGYRDIQVVTKPMVTDEGLAFVPWRERPEEQRAAFDFYHEGITVFGHGEIGGAIANSGRKSPGIVPAKQIEKYARACYLSHYHKRQKIGDRIWYLGSPYELDMGERDQPHGIALVTNEQIEPVWFDLDIFPRYWRLNYGDEWDLSKIKEDDIVEVQALPAEMVNPEFAEALAEIPGDVRPIPKELSTEDAPPAFALKLDDAIDQYVLAELEGTGHPFDEPELIALGKSILSEVPEARALSPLGSRIWITEITLNDFCVIPGELVIDVSKIRRGLITAPIGTGKTAIADAAMWCFFGETTPRKAGQSGATLRADAVINDYANECSVSCKVKVHGYKKTITITRHKKRGKGATVSIDGIDIKEGISDQGQLIQHVIGLAHPLWRACVSLGQGAVANFATDADKRRKDLLSSAFDLDPCPAAQKVAKKRLDNTKATLSEANNQLLVAKTKRETLSTQDFTEQIGLWEKEKQVALTALTKTGNEAKAKVEQCAELLKGEANWLSTKKQHDQRIENITKQLSELRPTARIAMLQRQYGALEAERAIVERDRNNLQTELSSLIEQANKGVAICDKCGQALPTHTVEQHIQSVESKLKSKETELTTFQSRLGNISVELDQLNTSGTQHKEQYEAALQESREALKKCDEALPQFARIRENMQNAQKELDKARKEYTQKAITKNPFEHQSELNRQEIEKLGSTIEGLENNIRTFSEESNKLSFWVEGFGPKGLPVLVLRTALYELEVAANKYMNQLLDGKLYCRLIMDGDDLRVQYHEYDLQGNIREREYEQLSGGQRRCVELAFAPFALSDLIFNRCGIQIDFLTIDELTTHLGQIQKKRVCEIIESIPRDNIIVIDHDLAIQGYFETVYELIRTDEKAFLKEAA